MGDDVVYMDWVKVIFGCLAMVGIAVSLAMLSLSRGVKGAPARPVLIGVTALLGIVSIGLFWMLSEGIREALTKQPARAVRSRSR